MKTPAVPDSKESISQPHQVTAELFAHFFEEFC